MKKIIIAAFAVCSAIAFAEEATPKKELTPEERAERRELMLKKTGGIVEKAGNGKVLYVNCQDFVDEKEVTERVDKIRMLLKYNIELRRGSWKLGDAIPDDASIVVYIVNDATLPMSLVALEARWGLVNTADLKLGNRFSKELSRVTTIMLGAAKSQFKASPMQTVTKPADLDKLMTDGFTMDSVSQIMANTKDLGITRHKMTSYLNACQEGWAAAPTNEYQKAIWDQVHALPEKPLKIEFDAKRDAGK